MLIGLCAVCLAVPAIAPVTAAFSTTDTGQGTHGSTAGMAKNTPAPDESAVGTPVVRMAGPPAHVRRPASLWAGSRVGDTRLPPRVLRV
jgi:hypothetical protein